MARRRVFQYGPTIKTPRSTRITTGVIKEPSRNGVILREGPGYQLGACTTTKSVLKKKVVKGIKQPGLFTPNFESPLD